MSLLLVERRVRRPDYFSFVFFLGFGLRFGFDFFGPPQMPRSFSGPDKMPFLLGPLKIAMAPSSCNCVAAQGRISHLLRGPKHRPAARAKQEMLINLFSVNTSTAYGLCDARYRRETPKKPKGGLGVLLSHLTRWRPLTGHTGAFYAERRPMIRPGKGFETTVADPSLCAGRLGWVV